MQTMWRQKSYIFPWQALKNSLQARIKNHIIGVKKRNAYQNQRKIYDCVKSRIGGPKHNRVSRGPAIFSPLVQEAAHRHDNTFYQYMHYTTNTDTIATISATTNSS
jgi:hypothetical protein